jgi:hypothetical protein
MFSVPRSFSCPVRLRSGLTAGMGRHLEGVDFNHFGQVVLIDLAWCNVLK